MNNNRKLRILIISSHFYPKVDGTVRAIDTIIRTLIKRNHQIILITRRLPNTSQLEVRDQVYIYRVGPSGRSLVTRFILSINQAKLAFKMVKNQRADILQCHGFSSMVACFFLKIIFRTPVILFFHGLPRMWGLKFKWRKTYEHVLSLPFEIFLIRWANKIVVRSEMFANILVNVYGRGFEKRIKVLPHPVDTNIFSFSAPKLTTPIILFVGSLARVYGVDLLLKATPFILQQIPESKIVIVGDGPLENHLKNMTNDLGIDKVVKFIGRIDNPKTLAKYYKMSTVVVIPLYYKGYILSLVSVEALSCGRPVVTTMMLDRKLQDVGVFTVNTYDPKDFAKSILHVIKDVDLPTISLLARNYVERHHSENKYADRLEDIYYELIYKSHK